METKHNERPDGNGTDEDSIKPVSSLLSHFENLAHLNPKSHPTAASTHESRSAFLETPNVLTSRASLDLPRPDPSNWSSSSSSSHARSAAHSPSSSRWLHTARHNHASVTATNTDGFQGRRMPARPVSMNVSSAQWKAPVLTIDTPRTASQTCVIPATENRNREIRTVPEPPPPRRPPSSQSRPSSRPCTPVTDSSGVVIWAEGRTRDAKNGLKAASLPPPVNRAEKPKIPATTKNTAAVSRWENAKSLAPASERISVGVEASPFSTPPSSPEKAPPSTIATNGDSSNRIPPLYSTAERGPRRAFPDPTPFRYPHRSATFEAEHDGSSGPRSATTVLTRDIKHPPPPIPMKRSETDLSGRRSARDSRDKHYTSDNLEDRPGLPPRAQARISRRGAPSQTGMQPSSDLAPRRSFDILSRPTITSNFSVRVGSEQTDPHFPPPPQRDTAVPGGRIHANSKTQPPPTPTQFARSPMRSVECLSTPPASNQRQTSRSTRIESEESEPPFDDAPIPRTDYPDFSNTNRRPPIFKSGTRGIHTKHDVRVFDVCGNYACTTGYFTRVWDLVSGEQILGLNHGETVKGLCIAFKPGNTMDDEGKLLWLGTNAGEIHEVDIQTQSIVSSRTLPSRREIIKIYRHKKELWTLDDEGKLLLWPPDESGSPNLQYSYSHPYDRVAKGHTFSMVVGDLLWLASGKEVRVYRPNSKDADFQVLKGPFGKSDAGEITSGTTSPKDGGLVYLGHADGKVSIYSAQDYSCRATLNVSLYKINCLAMVGDYLWAGYKTGMIYVYDISTSPWTVKKDWQAHDQAVCGLLLDSSSVWTVNRLQAVSLGTDNYIRLWDAMLEDDWLEARMHDRDIEYCHFREITAAVLTWNAGATVPGNLRDSKFIRDVVHPESPPDILVFGFQELVDLENKKITAKSILMSSKKKDSADKEHMSRQYRVWKDYLASCIHDIMPLDQPYVLLHTSNLIGLFTCVFIKQEESQRIRGVSATEVKRGMGGLHGNKGALVFRFILDDSSLCFINCHLAAGQSQTTHRNNDIAAILESSSLPPESSYSSRIDLFVGGGDGTMILDHEICILNGDLNYRIDSMPRNTVIEAVKARNLPKLLDRDQLLASRRKNPGFRLRAFNEAPITFAPTYKYDVGTDQYDSSEKKRSPAWCDRLLYRGVGRIKQLEYRRHEVKVSDHRPVSGLFKMRIKTISPDKRTNVWVACQEEFRKEKRRLATDASIDYLVRILGLDPQEARSLISTTPGTK
ncbi:type I inositol-1,4,5-trisphosphate 5-phosphatase [Histoplasma ohiense]|nr:type I inositol-1,4,5-trisphosphate 5-phosphatase [Histoplasma ohiense (nom. inval.)]